MARAAAAQPGWAAVPLASRIALLKKEEQRAWKKIEKTRVRAEEIVRMQELFGQDEAPVSVAKGKKKGKAKTTTILDSRRAANVSIMLKQFQSLLKVYIGALNRD